MRAHYEGANSLNPLRTQWHMGIGGEVGGGEGAALLITLKSLQNKSNFFPTVNLSFKISGRFSITPSCRSKLVLSYN